MMQEAVEDGSGGGDVADELPPVLDDAVLAIYDQGKESFEGLVW